MHANRPELGGLVAVLLTSSLGIAQVAWQEQLLRRPVPALRTEVALAFHEQLGRTILLGGPTQSGAWLNDTWAWDGDSWQQRFPAASPPGTRYHLVYDAARGVVVALGHLAGWQQWEYDGATWTQRITAPTPPPRHWFGLGFDRARARIVLFGGHTQSSSYLNDTWEWDGASWTQVLSPIVPMARANPSLAFDPARQRMMLLRGTVSTGPFPTLFDDQWEWDGASWTQLPTPSLPTSAGSTTTHLQSNRVIAFDSASAGTFWEWNGTTWTPTNSPQQPPAFYGSPVPYDSVRNRLVWFRSGTQPQTWEWDGATWLNLSTSLRPAPRTGHGMAFLHPSLRVVVFGGSNVVLFTDTLEWNGANWTRRTPVTSPPGRHSTNMVEHTSRGEIVLFGGQGTGGGGLADTWVWDGTNWTHRLPAFSPPPRHSHSLAYDAARDRVVLFGGSPGVGVSDTTYEWDGASWAERFPLQRPTARQLAAMAYDALRQRVVLFGGHSNLGDTWEYDGATWVRRFPAASPPPGFHMMAWDGSRARIVLFGNLNQTWEWDGTNWTPRSTAMTPPPRVLGGFAFDPTRARMVLFSGIQTSCKDDTWEYGPTSPASWAPYGSGCAGTAGTPALAPAPYSLPWLGETFVLGVQNVPAGQAAFVLFGSALHWGPLALPAPLGAFGMPGCTLFAGGDVLMFAPAANGTASVSVPIPAAAALLGVGFSSQAVVTDPGVNAAGLVASPAGTLTVGGR